MRIFIGVVLFILAINTPLEARKREGVPCCTPKYYSRYALLYPCPSTCQNQNNCYPRSCFYSYDAPRAWYQMRTFPGQRTWPIYEYVSNRF